MSAVLTVTVESRDLLNALNTVSLLVPKGQKTMPIGFYIDKGHIKIVCTQGVVYQSNILTDDYDNCFGYTVMYYDIAPLLHVAGTVDIEFSPDHSIHLYGDGFDTSFAPAYSTIQLQNFEDENFVHIPGGSYSDGFQKILNIGLEKLYGIASPIVVSKDISLQKFPNTIVQVRTMGFPVNAILDSDHVKLITKFGPTYVCAYSDSLVFKNQTSVLQIPCKRNTDETKMGELISKLGAPVTINMHSYLDKLRSISKLDSKATCKIAVYEKGLKSTLTAEQSSVSISTGDTESKVLKVFHLPMQVWLTFLKVLGTETIQVLVGEELLCLRTASVIILTRVLN